MSQDAFLREERLLRLLSRGFDDTPTDVSNRMRSASTTSNRPNPARAERSDAVKRHARAERSNAVKRRTPFCLEVALLALRVGRLAPCRATLPGFIGLGASSAFAVEAPLPRFLAS